MLTGQYGERVAQTQAQGQRAGKLGQIVSGLSSFVATKTRVGAGIEPKNQNMGAVERLEQ